MNNYFNWNDEVKKAVKTANKNCSEITAIFDGGRERAAGL